jgi:hypothetical protein
VFECKDIIQTSTIPDLSTHQQYHAELFQDPLVNFKHLSPLVLQLHDLPARVDFLDTIGFFISRDSLFQDVGHVGDGPILDRRGRRRLLL